VNCWVAPTAIVGLAGVTATDTNTGAVMVRPVNPLIDPDVAMIVVLPVPAPVAKPALVIVATEVLVELQTTEPVMFKVPPSLNMPVAVNCCVTPLAIEVFAGVTAIDTSVAVTVRFVEPLIEPEVAMIVVLPVPAPVASPALVIVATEVLVELQVTILVRFCVLLSL